MVLGGSSQKTAVNGAITTPLKWPYKWATEVITLLRYFKTLPDKDGNDWYSWFFHFFSWWFFFTFPSRKSPLNFTKWSFGESLWNIYYPSNKQIRADQWVQIGGGTSSTSFWDTPHTAFAPPKVIISQNGGDKSTFLLGWQMFKAMVYYTCRKYLKTCLSCLVWKKKRNDILRSCRVAIL